VTLVTFALPFESAAFRSRNPLPNVRVLHTGVGRKRALAAITKSIEEERPELVVISGFAGSLVPELRPGDLLVGENMTSGAILADLRNSPRPELSVARLHTASEIVCSASEKASLHRETGASAVDMESSEIFAFCAAQGIPAVTLRVVSDGADRDLCVPPRILSASASRPIAGTLWLLGFLATHPGRIASFIRFATECQRAQRVLARGLAGFLASIIHDIDYTKL